jgi:hypothetical protein
MNQAGFPLGIVARLRAKKNTLPAAQAIDARLPV